MEKKRIWVAVGVVENAAGQVFICRRSDDQHQAGKWEFPGGKIEEGETAEQAVIRELQEEVGITVTTLQQFDKLEYQFPDRHITLWFWLVNGWDGEPWGKEGQPGRWIAQQDLAVDEFPPANAPIIEKLIAS